MVRVSGTEPKIRIMVESKNALLAKSSAEELEKIVDQYDIEHPVKKSKLNGL